MTKVVVTFVGHLSRGKRETEVSKLTNDRLTRREKFSKPGFPHIFKNHFPYFFNTKLEKFNTTTSLHFLEFLIMKLNFTHCSSLHNQLIALPKVKFCSDTSDFFPI